MRTDAVTLGMVVGVEDRTMSGRRRVREGRVIGYRGRSGVVVQVSSLMGDRFRFDADGRAAGWLTPRSARLVERPRGRRGDR